MMRAVFAFISSSPPLSIDDWLLHISGGVYMRAEEIGAAKKRKQTKPRPNGGSKKEFGNLSP